MVAALTWLLVFATSCSSSRGDDQNTPTEVKTPAGTFKGLIQQSLQGYSYVAFLGIPYALPPVGDLRFAKPQPYPPSDNVYEASTNAPSCVQPAGTNMSIRGQEDCLYLNVYVPVVKNEGIREEDTPKKVFVFIHGGGLITGSAAQYVPGDLVAMGDIIVVTLNYRLSWLGFLKGTNSDLPGNQGIWDQLLALNWVKDNIRSFGGDPDDVTVGGHGMGATSVSLLSILPTTKGLFTKGIMGSSSMFNDPLTSESSDELLDILTENTGCQNTDPEATTRCLRNLPMEKFVEPPDPFTTRAFITIDGDLFTAPLKNLIKDTQYLTSAGFYSRDYLVTLTNNEGSIFFHGIHASKVEYEDLDPIFLSQWTNLSVPECRKLLAWYKEPLHSFFNPAFDVLADFEIYLPTIDFLETFVSRIRDSDLPIKGKVYLLWFDHMPLYIPRPLYGTIHGVDLNYLFDFQPGDALNMFYDVDADDLFTAHDWMVKKRYIEIVSDFVKTGNPSVTLSKDFPFKWPAYDMRSETYLRFDSFATLQKFPLRDRRLFWKNKIKSDNVLSHKFRDEL